MMVCVVANAVEILSLKTCCPAGKKLPKPNSGILPKCLLLSLQSFFQVMMAPCLSARKRWVPSAEFACSPCLCYMICVLNGLHKPVDESYSLLFTPNVIKSDRLEDLSDAHSLLFKRKGSVPICKYRYYLGICLMQWGLWRSLGQICHSVILKWHLHTFVRKHWNLTLVLFTKQMNASTKLGHTGLNSISIFCQLIKKSWGQHVDGFPHRATSSVLTGNDYKAYAQAQPAETKGMI